MKKSDIIRKYLNLIGVKCTTSYINKFNWHPYNNTLYGFYDFLKTYNLQTKSLQFNDILDAKMSNCLPLITLLNNHFVIIISIESEYVTYINKDGLEKTVLKEDFEKTWSKTGVYGHIENGKTREPYFEANQRNDIVYLITNYGVILSLFLITSIMIYLNIGKLCIVNVLYILSNCIGVIICIGLCKIRINRDGKYLKEICSRWKKTNCKTLLEYNGNKLLKLINLPCLGLSYFIVNLFSFNLNTNNLLYLYIYSYITIIISFWSILYQAWHKKWCTLCICTMMVIWIQFSILFYIVPSINISSIILSITDIFRILTIGLSYILLYFIIDRLLSIIVKYHNLRIKSILYNRLKFDNNVFNSLLLHSYKVDDIYKSILTFGSVSSQTKITILSNPFCNPCSELHRKLTNLIRHDCYIEYFFTYFDKEKSLANRYIIASYLQMGEDFTWKLLNNWYSLKHKNLVFFQQFNFDIDNESVLKEFHNHEEWTIQNNLDSTPAILVNSHLLPYIYDLNDLELLINWKE